MNKVLKYTALFAFFLLLGSQLKSNSEDGNSIQSTELLADTIFSTDDLYKLSAHEMDQGNYSLAAKYLFDLEEIIEDDKEKTQLYIRLSEIYHYQGNEAKATKYTQLAEDNINDFPNEQLLGDIFWLKGLRAFASLKYTNAYQNTLKALVFFNSNNSVEKKAKALDLLCSVYFEQNKLVLAAQCAHKLKKIGLLLNDKVGISKAYNSLAVIYARSNKKDSSLVFANTAMQLAQQDGSLLLISRSYQTFSIINEFWGNADEALVYFKKHTVLNDSLNSGNRAREMAQLEAVHEAENQKLENRKLLEATKIQNLTIKSKEAKLKLYLVGLLLLIFLGIVAVYFLNKSRIANKKLLKLSKEMRESRDKIKLTSDKLRSSNKKLVKIQAALIAQKDTALRASSAKDVFLSSVSHELRTPLTAILGLTEELLPEAKDAQTKDNLEVIKFSGETLLSLVNDILDFNKIQSGKIDLENISFNLKEYLNKQVKGLKPRARQNASNIIFNYDENVPEWVIADPIRIGQVINNLLSNAVKFTNKGQVELKVEMLQKQDDLHHILFSVIDQGIGIPKDKLEHIFERFTQASADTTRKYGGTGLGLAISKRIVELYKSQIHVESEEGVGSTFSFVLKLKKGERSKADDVVLEISDLPSEIKILLVEDNVVNQKLVAKAFSGIGINIEIVSNGRQALDCLEKSYREFDVILMDMHMPVMDGMEATVEIRKKGGYLAEIPIIGLSGSTVKEPHELREIGLSAFMQKPFKKDDLLKLVAEQIVRT